MISETISISIRIFHSMETDSNPDAAGLLRRAFALLRLLAAAGRRGQPLTALSRQSGLAHGTVHRLLRQLADERMVIQLPQTRRYALGPLSFELGVAAYPYDLRTVSRPILERLAVAVDDSIFLTLRSGDESVCIDLQPGPSPIRVVTLEIGTRRPLGIGAGGLAILGAMPAEERSLLLDRIEPLLDETWGLSKANLRASVQKFDEEGYAFIRNRVHAGISAIGYPIRGDFGQPIAALSIAALNERMTPGRLPPLVRELQRSAAELQKQLGRPGVAQD